MSAKRKRTSFFRNPDETDLELEARLDGRVQEIRFQAAVMKEHNVWGADDLLERIDDYLEAEVEDKQEAMGKIQELSTNVFKSFMALHSYLPLLVALRKPGPTGDITRHGLWTREVLRSVLKLVK
jgi:hypothetical protein